MSCKERRSCRACMGDNLDLVVSLGDQPLANALPLVTDQSEDAKFPLDLMRCPVCGHLQLGHVVSARHLYDDYLFQTGMSNRAVLRYSGMISEYVRKCVPDNGLVVEIGSNDGSVISTIESSRVRLVGVDPAKNLAKIARSRGVDTVEDFFGVEAARGVVDSRGNADLIVACNVVGHIDDLDDFFSGVSLLLSKNGTMVIEVPYSKDVIDGSEFDTIYHEHLSYWSVSSMSTVLLRHGFVISAIEHHDVYGGSLRFVINRGECVSDEVLGWIKKETEESTIHDFASNCQKIRDSFIALLHEAKGESMSICGYTAPAKSTVLLNYCNVGTDLIPVILDSTTSKQGRRIPGTKQPIVPSSMLSEINPDVAVVFAWNHLAEISIKEHRYLDNGGKFVVPYSRKGN